MSKLRVNAFSVSADGFGAGPDQSRDQPLGRDHLVLFDNLAAMTADADMAFDVMRRFYTGDDRVQVPEMLFNGVRQAVERVAAH